MKAREAVEAPGTLFVQAQNCRGCRSCQLACSFVKHGVFNPGKSMIVMERDPMNGYAAPMIKPLGCDQCSGDPACAHACKYGAITYDTGPSPHKVLVRA
jgi:carbon-monoxide dehydrogenase iron sulfur subunit